MDHTQKQHHTQCTTAHASIYIQARTMHEQYDKPATEREQVLADISHSALYAFAVYKAISLYTCVLS